MCMLELVRVHAGMSVFTCGHTYAMCTCHKIFNTTVVGHLIISTPKTALEGRGGGNVHALDAILCSSAVFGGGMALSVSETPLKSSLSNSDCLSQIEILLLDWRFRWIK